ncbi:MAG: Asp-tRNA(Asn)/Glu-tRNA(Gln) amidotransferase subunit GatA [Methanosarcinaceae archaeon]|nr:Asp-tRNA(Asn)/Glu-tRNA(Gln) amidotransferase subunit GatA [Methanosarcinaceae archaeon]
MSETIKSVKEYISKEGAKQAFKRAENVIKTKPECENAIITYSNPDFSKVTNESGKLYGIPIVISDNISTKDIETTCASNILKGYIPPYKGDAEQKLEAEGAVILGKGNINEFLIPNAPSFIGDVKNPYDDKYTAGPAGGCAVSVLAGSVPVSVASDAYGAVRLSASYTGITGFRPTYGAISRYGLIYNSGSTDQVSILANKVSDCATVANVLGGHDKRDTMSLLDPLDFEKGVSKARKKIYDSDLLEGIKIGIPENFIEGADFEIVKNFEKAIKIFESLGAVCETCWFEAAEFSNEIHEIITAGEASAMLAKYDGTRFGQRIDSDNWHEMVAKTRTLFGKSVQDEIIFGTNLLRSKQIQKYYMKALKLRTDLVEEINSLFKTYDFLISPTTIKIPAVSKDLENWFLTDKSITSINLAGLPAISVPFKKYNGIPTGIQIAGNLKKDSDVLKTAYIFEKKSKGEN